MPTNDEVLGTDRSYARAPEMRDFSAATAQAKANLITTGAQIAAGVDKLVQERKLNKELEAIQGAASAAGVAYDVLEGNAPDKVDADGNVIGKVGLDDVFKSVEGTAAEGALKEFYKDVDSLKAAHAQGKLRGTQFEVALDAAYRKAATARPGYRDAFRQKAAQFLGYDPGQAVNRRIFGFGPGEDGKTESSKAKFDRELGEESLEWLLKNRANSTEQAQQLRSLYESNPDTIINMSAREQTFKNNVAEKSAKLDLIKQDKQFYSEQVQVQGKLMLADKFDNDYSTMLAVAADGLPDAASNPTEYIQALQNGTAPLVSQYEQVLQNPDLHTRQILSDLNVDVSILTAEAYNDLRSDIIDRATQTLDMLKNPAYVTAVTNFAKGLPAAERTKLMSHDGYLRFTAIFGDEVDGNLLGMLTGLEEGKKLFSAMLGPYLRGEKNGTPTPEEFRPVPLSSNEVMDSVLDPAKNGSLVSNSVQRVDESPGIDPSVKDQAKSATAGQAETQNYNVLKNATVTEDNKETIGQSYIQGMDDALNFQGVQ